LPDTDQSKPGVTQSQTTRIKEGGCNYLQEGNVQIHVGKKVKVK